LKPTKHGHNNYLTKKRKIVWKYIQIHWLHTAVNSKGFECPFSDTDARGDESSSDPSRTGDGGRGGAT